MAVGAILGRLISKTFVFLAKVMAKNVLPDPKSPPWGCKCGEWRNWASRTACMSCGKEAPQRIVAAAKKNAVPGSGTPQRAGGAWAHGPPGKSAAGGRNGGYGTSSGKDKDKDGDPTTGDTLRALIAKLTKIGEVDLAKPLQAKLDEVVRQQREEKPISQTLRAIERKISDKKLTIEGYGSRIIAAETDVERTQQKLQREREGKAARETELAGLQRELEEATKGAQTATGMGSPIVP